MVTFHESRVSRGADPTNTGRFSPRRRSEADGGVTALASVQGDRAQRAAEAMFDEGAGSAGREQLAVTVRAWFRELLPHMSDDEFAAHLDRVVHARVWADRFIDDPDAATEDDEIGNSLIDYEDYRASDGPDRPGEADNVGYDYEAMGRELASAWTAECRTRVELAIALDRMGADRSAHQVAA